jgi:hypothetical protein
MVSFLLFSFKVGSRTDVVALGCGVLVYETGKIRLRVRHLAMLALLACLLYLYLQVVEHTRDDNAGAGLDPTAAFLLKDYYAPAHILFASIAYEYVRPGEVIASNAANSLMMLNHPYLQQGITDIFNPGVATRSAGYAFYVFSEGYMFGGFPGFVYNGVVLGALLSVWRALATTRSENLNKFILALIGTMLVNMSREQTSYFIKIAYSFFFPVTILYLALNRQALKVKTSLPGFRHLLVERRTTDTVGGSEPI